MFLTEKQVSQDGSTKYLWLLDDGLSIESIIFCLHGQTIACISSQVGCNVKCPFCATGKQNVLRNVTATEMIGQVRGILGDLGRECIDEIDFAGMGEPGLNFEHVRAAASQMIEGQLTSLVSLTTSGIVPAMNQLATTAIGELFVSLHASTDEKRNALVPVNKKWPIQDVLGAARAFASDRQRPVTLNYLLFAGINDSDDDLSHLIQLVDPRCFRVQLSEWNRVGECSFGDRSFVRSARLDHFLVTLKQHGRDAYPMRSQGTDIDGGCGQLRGRSSKSLPILS